MGNFLVKLFIKDHENIKDKYVREKYGLLASFIGIFIYLFLFSSKIFIGIITGSLSIIVDAFNNLSDSATAIISFVGFKLSNKPADAEHPFGHGRVEYISALIVSFFMIFIGLESLKYSIERIINPVDIVFNMYIVLFLVFTSLLNVWLSLFNTKLGKKINSPSLTTIGIDSRNDCITTICTIISLLIIQFTRFNWDGYISLLVSLFVLKSGYEVAKSTISLLTGESIDKELYTIIKNKIESYSVIIGMHDLIIHSYGPSKNMATVHVEISIDMTPKEVHNFIENIEYNIEKEFGINLVIHVDYVDLKDERLFVIKEIVNNILLTENVIFDAHDFRIIKTANDLRVIFDMMVPYDTDSSKILDIENKIKNDLNEVNKEYVCFINIENSYLNT